MLDNKAVQRRVAQYISEGIIQKARINNTSFFLTNAKHSLDCAKLLYNASTQEELKKTTGFSSFNGFLWVINVSYYAMFYSARALLESEGKTIKTTKSVHSITYDALIQYGYLNGKLAQAFIESFQESKEEATELLGREAGKLIEDYGREKEKRAMFTYEIGEIALQNKAKTSLDRAIKFIEAIRKIV